ncbi:dUTP diphosphatase [Parasphaerochaeta coccoides]|uniref:Deoxyuridine 5'-triphosphate nucleotidohydrolase n=1 Tax=Parasphaerochaeta coccoides (strain ATCC BAA-1237 / DSM 17374 / SPN1) TaxID=760011 RepID=F4GK56_PARC1|nr:dUTP diphosphatase [Parasphaerochaeta coccoides]AEC01828.1 deoxyuridine 5'-triphosphate nucleotidohydrolase [Parasphaerochaeta coccoides DSM 17374]
MTDGPVVKIILEEGASAPSYETAYAAGADVRAWLPDSDLLIPPGATALVPTGLRIALPQGYEAQIRPRSGLAAKFGVTVLNAPGTIDADYRGEIRILLINHGDKTFTIASGDRIAQMVIASHVTADFRPALSLDGTERGAGGFGSTGR